MRTWEQALRRDTEVWTDFQVWLQGIIQRELERMTTVSRDEHDLQRGKVEGVRMVLFEATSAELEDKARARRDPAGAPPRSV